MSTITINPRFITCPEIAPMLPGRTTLTQFIIEEQRRIIGATGEFTTLLNDVATLCKGIGYAVGRGLLNEALEPSLGQGEQMRAMANELLLSTQLSTGRLAALASAVQESPSLPPVGCARGRYLMVCNPIDVDANLRINMSMGTLFSILHAPSGTGEACEADFLQAGTRQVCAGFALYGPVTMLVFTSGDGVNGFTLDRDLGDFVLTHPHMSIPAECTEFAINASNERFWEPPIKRYVTECLDGVNGERAKDFNMRWVASPVAATFRILSQGGVYMYPLDERNRQKGGRARLLFEANPIAFIIEQAGGAATTGRQARLLETEPTSLHQHVPLIFGSRTEVERIVTYYADYLAGRDEPTRSPLFGTRSLFR
jgi:fructose-1,6-bisphosphatase